MKKIIGFLSFIVAVTVVSCTAKEPQAKKEVIVVPAAPVIVVKDPPVKSTTVTFDKKGVKVETKKN